VGIRAGLEGAGGAFGQGRIVVRVFTNTYKDGALIYPWCMCLMSGDTFITGVWDCFLFECG
jgi:hypothetical protein